MKTHACICLAQFKYGHSIDRTSSRAVRLDTAVVWRTEAQLATGFLLLGHIMRPSTHDPNVETREREPRCPSYRELVVKGGAGAVEKVHIWSSPNNFCQTVKAVVTPCLPTMDGPKASARHGELRRSSRTRSNSRTSGLEPLRISLHRSSVTQPRRSRSSAASHSSSTREHSPEGTGRSRHGLSLPSGKPGLVRDNSSRSILSLVGNDDDASSSGDMLRSFATPSSASRTSAQRRGSLRSSVSGTSGSHAHRRSILIHAVDDSEQLLREAIRSDNGDDDASAVLVPRATVQSLLAYVYGRMGMCVPAHAPTHYTLNVFYACTGCATWNLLRHARAIVVSNARVSPVMPLLSLLVCMAWHLALQMSQCCASCYCSEARPAAPVSHGECSARTTLSRGGQ